MNNNVTFNPNIIIYYIGNNNDDREARKSYQERK